MSKIVAIGNVTKYCYLNLSRAQIEELSRQANLHSPVLGEANWLEGSGDILPLIRAMHPGDIKVEWASDVVTTLANARAVDPHHEYQMMASVPDTDEGRAAEAGLKEKGIQLISKKTNPENTLTTCYVISHTDDNDKTVLAVPGKVQEKNFIEPDKLADADAILLTAYAGDTGSLEDTLNQLQAVKKPGATTLLHLASVYSVEKHHELLRQHMNSFDCVLGNEQQYNVLRDASSALPVEQQLLAGAPTNFYITRASKGSTVIADGKIIDVPPVPVHKVVDASSAGDTFNSGVLLGALHKANPVFGAELGGHMAADIVQKPGTTLSSPDSFLPPGMHARVSSRVLDDPAALKTCYLSYAGDLNAANDAIIDLLTKRYRDDVAAHGPEYAYGMLSDFHSNAYIALLQEVDEKLRQPPPTNADGTPITIHRSIMSQAAERILADPQLHEGFAKFGGATPEKMGERLAQIFLPVRTLASYFTPGEERQKFMEVSRNYNRGRFEKGRDAAIDELIVQYGITGAYGVMSAIHGPVTAYPLVVSRIGALATAAPDSADFIARSAETLGQAAQIVHNVLRSNQKLTTVTYPREINPRADIEDAVSHADTPHPVLAGVASVSELGNKAKSEGWQL